MRPPRRLLASFGLAGVIAAASPAAAQEQQNIDLPEFDPAPAGDRFFGVPSPHVPGRVAFHGGVVLDYAHNPLVLTDRSGELLNAIVEHQMFLHVNVAFALFDRIEVNADMPFALLNQGDGSVAGGGFQGANAFQSPNEAGVGDLRLGARVRFFGEYFDPFQIGLGGYVWVPTATDGDFLGNGNARGQVHLLVGGRADRFIYSVMAGTTLRGQRDFESVSHGHEFVWGAGLGALVGTARNFQIGVETTGGVTVENTNTRSTNAEALVGIKYRFISPLELGVGVGPGFASGVGTPDFRGVFSFFYTPEMKPKVVDTDGDGIFDDVDACKTIKGVKSEDPKKNGCPPPGDRDKDKIIDDEDACPDEAGVADEDPKKNGCPVRDDDKDDDTIKDADDACPETPGVADPDPKKNGCPIGDKDGDSILDDKDACPEIPGVADPDPQKNGCPPDTDGDGFRDDVDACPKEKGVDNKDPSLRGCPPKDVVLTETEIVILEQVQFDTGRATIKPVSSGLLDAVAQVLKDHPEITLLEVQGHTDNRGGKIYNSTLSSARAETVKNALTQRGIAANRLTAKGYGMDVPIADNDTDEGRQKNRRVQFVVKQKTGGPPVVTK